jgi:hypothetical protein
VLLCTSKVSTPLHLSVTVPIGTTAEVNVPAVANLGQTVQNLAIVEGQTTVWKDGKYVPGVAGITGGAVNPTRTGVVLQVQSGKYTFVSSGQ